MKALELCRKLYPNSIDQFKIDKEIGYGADGEVYSLFNDQTKVIKFSRFFEYQVPIEKELLRLNEVFSFLKLQSVSGYSKLLEYQIFDIQSRDTTNGIQRFLLYFSVMERCSKISEDEKKVFHTILSHEDSNKTKDFSDKKLKSILLGLSKGLYFDINKVLTFCDNIKNCKVIQPDSHPRNIMLNSNGEFCFTDFDRCYLEK